MRFGCNFPGLRAWNGEEEVRKVGVRSQNEKQNSGVRRKENQKNGLQPLILDSVLCRAVALAAKRVLYFALQFFVKSFNLISL